MPDVVAYRAFQWNAAAKEGELGGARFVHRTKQGSGRHDSPAYYGVYYCAATEEAAIGEVIQAFRGQKLTDDDLVRFGLPMALVEITFSNARLVDLDDPPRLIEHKTKPSIVASGRRDRTQELARRIFDSKADGISWWSTLLADWTNYSMFTDGTAVKAIVRRGPVALDTRNPSLKSAAIKLGVRL